MNAAIHVAGWTLVHFAWQGALVGVAAAIALRLLRHAAPQSRYAVGVPGARGDARAAGRHRVAAAVGSG